MNRTTWRQLASGLLAATLSLGIAACDDDTSSGTGDMAVGADMSAEVDMTMTGPPGIGQIVLADVVGTVFSGATVAPRTHALIGIASFPKVVPMSDPSSDLSLTPPGGCTINRYTATNLPSSDGDAGDVTISGWNQAVIGVSASGTGASGNTMYPITCKRSGPLMTYTCSFAGSANSDGGGMGMTTDSVIFPLTKQFLVDHNTQGTIIKARLDWPAAFDGACVQRVCAVNVMPAPNPACALPAVGGCDVICCEQAPVAFGGSNITEAFTGGTDFMAASHMLGVKDDSDAGTSEFPQPVYLLSVTQGSSTTNLAGTEPFTGGPSLTMADGAIDKTKDLTLSFSCDASATVGGGCAGLQDLAALLVKTSTNARTAFSVGSTATGSAECISTLAMGKITIKAAQLTALVGSQTTGSFQLALARLRLAPTQNPSGHLVAFSGGMGVFGFTNQ